MQQQQGNYPPQAFPPQQAVSGGVAYPPGAMGGYGDAAGYAGTGAGMAPVQGGPYAQQCGAYPPGAFPQQSPMAGGTYPPAAMAGGYAPAMQGQSGFPVAQTAPVAMGAGALGAAAAGGLAHTAGDDLYAVAQQFGLNREEADAALSAYAEMNGMDRGVLSSFGLGHVQKMLGNVFGGGHGHDSDHAHSLAGSLTTALSSGRVPPFKDFLGMLGAYKLVRPPPLPHTHTSDEDDGLES
jgi:hypothetical protein